MALFVLDEGFPETIFEVARLMPGVELRRLREVDSRLVGNSDDWAILLRLHQLDEPYDGLVTVDHSMTMLPKEMAVLHQTKLTLVALEDSGNDPVRATGLCLLHLPYIARETVPDRPQLWLLRPPPRRPSLRAWDQLGEIASRQGGTAIGLFNGNRLSADQIETEMWDWYGGIEETY